MNHSLTYDNLEVEENLPRHLLVLLQGGEDGEGEAEEDHEEDAPVVQERQLPAGPFQKVVRLGLNRRKGVEVNLFRNFA